MLTLKTWVMLLVAGIMMAGEAVTFVDGNGRRLNSRNRNRNRHNSSAKANPYKYALTGGPEKKDGQKLDVQKKDGQKMGEQKNDFQKKEGKSPDNDGKKKTDKMTLELKGGHGKLTADAKKGLVTK